MRVDGWVGEHAAWERGSACVSHAVEYYSATKRKEILPSATTRLDLGDVMLSEAS